MDILKQDELIAEITEVLSEGDGEFIEKIANQVLSGKVRFIDDKGYLGDLFFELDCS